MAIDKIQSESINLADTFAFTGTVTGVGGANTPAFMANLGSSQSISNNTGTKVNMNTEIFDTDSKYDTSNYRFTPTIAGKYHVFVQLMFTAYGGDGTQAGIKLLKNGNEVQECWERSAYNSNFDFYLKLTSTVVLDDDDYLEVMAVQQSGVSKTIYHGSLYTFWGAYKIIT